MEKETEVKAQRQLRGCLGASRLGILLDLESETEYGLGQCWYHLQFPIPFQWFSNNSTSRRMEAGDLVYVSIKHQMLHFLKLLGREGLSPTLPDHHPLSP